jgi:hypothetical protein
MTPRNVACQGLVELVTEVAAVDQHLADRDPCLRYLHRSPPPPPHRAWRPPSRSPRRFPIGRSTLLEAFRKRR